MALLPQLLFILHADVALRARVQRAVPPGLHLVELPEWDALRGAVLRATLGSLAVVDPFHAHATAGPAAALSRLLRDFPKLPVLAVARFAAVPPADLLTLGAWGVADVLGLGRDDGARALRRRLWAQRTGCFVRLLAAISGPGLSPAARRLIADALEVAAGGGGAQEWAPLRGVSGATVLRSCRLAKLPPPRRLLAWMRVLLAADLLESPGHTVATAAVACGYASDMPLRRAVRNLTGLEAPELSQAGGLSTVGALLARELTRWRTREG